MTDSGSTGSDTNPLDLSDNPLSYRGRMGRKQYWIGLAIALVFAVFAMVSFASVMSPTGGGAPFLAIPLLMIFFWIHSLITVKRLRDAGLPA